MANTKNSQAAKIRTQIIAWLQDEQQTEVVSSTKFPGVRGIRAVKLRQMLGTLGYVPSVVLGAVSAAPSIDARIKKATVKPREVYYYFNDGSTSQAPKRGAAAQLASSPAQLPATPTSVQAAPAARSPRGLSSTTAFKQLQATTGTLNSAIDNLLTAAQAQAPLTDQQLDFLSTLADQVAKQNELLQAFTVQERITALRGNHRGSASMSR